MAQNIRKCNTCGKIFCFSDEEYNKNITNSALASLSALGTMTSAMGGNRLGSYAMSSQTDRLNAKVIDYNRCPSCNSSDISYMSEKELKESQEKTRRDQVVQNIRSSISSNATVDSLLSRIKLFIENEDWDSATAYCEHIFDLNPECAQAYVYMLMSNNKVKDQEKLATVSTPLSKDRMYINAIRFGDEELKSKLESYNNAIILDNEEKNLKKYLQLTRRFDLANSLGEYNEIKEGFRNLDGYRDSNVYISKCDERRGEILRKEEIQRVEDEKKNFSKKAIYNIIAAVIILFLFFIYLTYTA